MYRVEEIADLNAFIRSISKQRGIGVRELSRRANTNHQTIQNVMKHSNDMKLSTALQVLNALGYDIAVVPHLVEE